MGHIPSFFASQRVRRITATESKPTPAAILVVEDDLLLRMDIVTILQDEGFTVVEAGNADEAIVILEARRDIRIVFTDIQMPGSMDGIRLAAAVRDRWPPIDIILTSGRGNIRREEMPERALFFHKPVKPPDLVGAMREVFAHSPEPTL